jgi:flavoprotein
MDIKDAKEQLKDFYATEEELKDAIDNDDIQDAISEIADSNVDIYYSDIYASLDGEMADYIEEARQEGLIGTDTPIDKQIQIGQYVKNERALYEALEELKGELE